MYDVIICGGGPAGMTAAIYSARGGMKTLIIERALMGGQSTMTEHIENYPGFLKVEGFELASKMQEQVTALGVDVVFEEVTYFDLKSDIKKVKTVGGEYAAKALILATGADSRRLGLSNEGELMGRGVSYCATCDGAFFKNKIVAVAGGGNTAAEDALYLARFCEKVYIIHRRDALRAAPITFEKIKKEPKIEVLWNSVIKELKANEKLDAIIIKDVKTGAEREIKAEGLFVAVGQVPNTESLKGTGLELNEGGYIKVDKNMRTNLKGVYAAGDVTDGDLKQIITACSDGAKASDSIQKDM